jgi:hypothetical protein
MTHVPFAMIGTGEVRRAYLATAEASIWHDEPTSVVLAQRSKFDERRTSYSAGWARPDATRFALLALGSSRSFVATPRLIRRTSSVVLRTWGDVCGVADNGHSTAAIDPKLPIAASESGRSTFMPAYLGRSSAAALGSQNDSV